jgi:DNA-binding MarR family transcriptional regulator
LGKTPALFRGSGTGWQTQGALPGRVFHAVGVGRADEDAILRARERDYARFGISNERRAALFIIQNNGGRATPVEIARDLFRELHSVTEMLKRMEADGLVTRHKGSGRSKVEVELTEKGFGRVQPVPSQRD